MADHSKPLTTSTYANFVTELDGRLDDITLGLDPANTSPTNLPTNAIRWSSAALKWQKWDGTTFNDLAASYTININGTVGATTPAAGTFTTLSSTGNTTLGNATADTVTITGTIQPGVVVSGSSATDMFRITQTGTGNAFVVEDEANPDASPFVINTDGDVGIGTTSPDGNLEVSGIATTQYLTRHSTDPSSANFVIRKSRGTEAARTVVVSGDNLGAITFQGYDTANNFVTSAQIIADSEGTIGSNRMPSRLLLRTGTNATPTVVATAVTIDSSQVTNFTNGIQVNAINAYALKGISYKTGSGTYTTPSKVRAIYVEAAGGGGGGGGVDGDGANTAGASRSGGGGAYCAKFITSPAATYTFAVGAGGSGGASGNNDGAAGGDTTFVGTGTSLTANGGGAGAGSLATSGNSQSTPGGTGGSSTGGDINLSGSRGGARAIIAVSGTAYIAAVSQAGECPMFGGGRAQSIGNAGTDGANFGGGGGGASVSGTTTNYAGGDGKAGTIRITEYY